MLNTAAKIRVARALYGLLHELRRPFGLGDQVRVKRAGVHWQLDLREGIDLTIYLFGAFERQTLRTLESLVKPGAIVLDIGANIGAHTLHLARLVGRQGRVIALEPTDYAFEKLRVNLAANPSLSERVTTDQVFLAARASAIPAAPVASSWPVDGTPPDDLQMGSRTMTVSGARTATVDDIVAASAKERVQLVKMDVDGHELEVLEGARGMLERDRPLIVMELAPYAFEPTQKFDRMIQLLEGAGYTFRKLGSSHDLPRGAPALRRKIPAEGSINVVAVPREHR